MRERYKNVETFQERIIMQSCKLENKGFYFYGKEINTILEIKDTNFTRKLLLKNPKCLLRNLDQYI